VETFNVTFAGASQPAPPGQRSVRIENPGIRTVLSSLAPGTGPKNPKKRLTDEGFTLFSRCTHTDGSSLCPMRKHTREDDMDVLQHHRAMEAFCKQHAKMDGEDPAFWLAAAEAWARRAANLRTVIRLQPEADVQLRRRASGE
jgi:hypothetical protein